ncbi:MAG: double-strand break repair helicase AddA [Proteobacteria bacterium]|nr:double-strand break repair helicase AddA [Pseudomonadota bacterium]
MVQTGMTVAIHQKRREIGTQAGQQQSRALAPQASVWVSASAGTGKTYVLTRRILQLLVSGAVTHAGEVLALTFTKAAAAEMQNRLHEELRNWAVMDDAALADTLHKLTGRVPDAAQLARARGLFIGVLDTPGGLNISTIHSFCQSLLARFPLEARIAPGFTLLEDRQQAETVWEAVTRTIDRTIAGEGAPLWCFELLADTMAEQSLREVFLSFVGSRRRFARLLAPYGSMDAYLEVMAAELGLEDVPDAEAETSVLAAAQAPDDSRDVPLRGTIEALARGGVNARKAAESLATYLAADAAGRKALWPMYLRVFLTTTNEPRKAVADKPAREIFGDGIDEILGDEQARILAVLDTLNAVRLCRLTEAYLRMGSAIAETYQALKDSRSALDFDDLIDRTVALLTTDAGQAAWVRYKMDVRIRHILLDEAQDTDSDQWGILQSLMEDFYSGSGTHADSPRTYFAVGDMKQSIYRFRGAEPAVFAAMRAHMELRAPAVGHTVERVELNTSFRSGEAVLHLVDSVFADPKRRAAVDELADDLRHHAHKVGAGGRVEIWQPQDEAKTTRTKIDDLPRWPMPVRGAPKPTATSTLYARVADAIVAMTTGTAKLGTTGRVPDYGDIMVLMRSRTHMGELIAALNARGIKHTGADEVLLNDDPVVADLLALGHFMANSADDLHLAHTLRSPLFALTDAELYALHKRRTAGGSLWSVLYDCTDAPYVTIAQTLKNLLEKADILAPHGLFTAALVATEGRSRFVARYGSPTDAASWAAVSETLDAFLDQTLAYAQSHVPSMTGFLHWFESGQMKVKKESTGGGAVRLMTVHKSKGLQAPIVILPEATAPFYRNTATEKLVWREQPGGQGDDLFLYGVSNQKAPALLSALREEEKERIFKDEMRLLYVALTRAQDRLIITGAPTNAFKGKADDCWLNHILAASEADIAHPWRVDEGMRVLDIPTLLHEAPKLSASAFDDEAAELGDWVFTPAPEEAAVDTWQTDANAAEESDKVTELLSRTGADAYRRGLLVHRMLEVLPAYPQAEHRDRAVMFLAAAAPDWDDAVRSALVADVMAVMGDYPELFDGAARAEVEMVIRPEAGGAAHNLRADCLVVRDEGVLIVDYKTNVRVPKAVPAAYVRQLAGYRDAAHRLWPQKKVKTAILWTAATPPRLEWVDM